MRYFIRYRRTLRRQKRFAFGRPATVSVPVVGTSSGIATVAGMLSGNGYLEAVSSGSSTVSGLLRAEGYIEGSSDGQSTTSGHLYSPADLVGDSSGQSSESGLLRGKGYLNGSASGSSQASAFPQLPGGFIQGSVFGTSSVSGILLGVAGLEASENGSSSASGTLSAVGSLSASENGLATTGAVLRAIGYLSGSSVGSSSASIVPVEVVPLGEGVPMLSAGIWRKSQPNTILFVLVDEDGEEVLGLGSTFTLQIRRVGGSFQNGAGTKSEVGLGWYQYISTPAEASISGPVAIVVTHVLTDRQNLEYVIEDRVVNAVEFTYTLTSTVGSVPISNVNVSFSTDSNPENTIWSGITDSFGVARDLYGNLPRLTPGTYIIFADKPGFVFEIDQEVVS